MEEIWEPYLTEQDKQHLAASKFNKTEPFGFGEHPALLIIDDYYSVLGLDREPILESVKKWPMSCGLEGWEAIDRTVELLASARANDIPVIFVKGFDKGFTPWGRRKGTHGPSPISLDHLSEYEQEKAVEIVAELEPLPGELVLDKAAASAFHGTPLVFHLNYLNVDTVIACGETTSGCVRASVVDGATYRYRMGVVAECCFDRTQSAHAINLFDMHQKYADVVSLETTQKYFESIAADRALAGG